MMFSAHETQAATYLRTELKHYRSLMRSQVVLIVSKAAIFSPDRIAIARAACGEVFLLFGAEQNLWDYDQETKTITSIEIPNIEDRITSLERRVKRLEKRGA